MREKIRIEERDSLKTIATIFLRLGLIAFGGPAVHIAMMKEEVVRKRKWMSEAHFLDLIGATNLIPGPNSTEMAMHIGQKIEHGFYHFRRSHVGVYTFPVSDLICIFTK